jgi:hypothetical protein
VVTTVGHPDDAEQFLYALAVIVQILAVDDKRERDIFFRSVSARGYRIEK